ncbi:MAG: 16S rRNA (adenine(1518)-N(6)/adenine(1519)-N(6))-dimethyltransferase RsmA [Candidatus Adiutrix sp.]|nr:16S rRNA (adenine(1518)-N(6)/adenine(1519)-N(6))-dimethyltransferase RsmA [Candidatus Adiutrix sp.]
MRDVLKELGLAPLRRRSQNFLKDPGLIAEIVEAILKRCSGKTVNIIEIGPGLGALTVPLLAAGARIWAVELDRGLAENLRKLDFGDRLTVINQDILTFDPTEAASAASEPPLVCGNLPYNISSPILFWFLERLRLFSGGLFMLQKEMADRLTAAAGARAYGRLAAALGLWCEIEKVMTVSPAAFHPRPKVESAIVALRPLPSAPLPPISVDDFGRFTAAAFAARRKTIFNNLSRAYGRARAEAALAEAGLAPGLRAETLPPEILARLAAFMAENH